MKLYCIKRRKAYYIGHRRSWVILIAGQLLDFAWQNQSAYFYREYAILLQKLEAKLFLEYFQNSDETHEYALS